MGIHKRHARPSRSPAVHTRGDVAPEDAAAARDRYRALAPLAETVVREATSAMGFDREEYEERVTPEVVTRVQEALFAARLEVHVGTRAEFDAWADDRDDVVVLGAEAVDHVAWHDPSFGDAVAATFQNEEDAAVDTLRRQAFGRVYRDVL